MSAVLEQVEEITVAEIEAENRAYERLYGISTAQLLSMIACKDAGLEEIPDAGFWRMNAEALQRWRTSPQQPEINDEDPKWVLVHFETARFRKLLSRGQRPHRDRKEFLRP